MEPAEALADLTEISPQIEAAVIFDATGTVVGSTLADDERSREVARLGRQLLAEADQARRSPEVDVAQLQVELASGSVFVVRQGDRAIAATTGAEPTVGLVFYDLGSCLRSAAADGGDAQEHDASP
jgi:predicted regulator of Ras-like GTPase activity (Roadblock/LC7/MglB family)